MSTHTPGPWTIEPDAEGEPDFFSIWYDVDGMGAEIAGRIGEEANARLIAAAPELLAALRDLVARCDGDEGVRADGSNIQTLRAHAVLDALDAEGARP